MPKPRQNRFWLFWYALLFTAVAQADSAPLPEAFWDYFIEFGDQQGEVFDPMDLAESEQLQQQKPEPLQAGALDSAHDNPISTHNDNEEQQP